MLQHLPVTPQSGAGVIYHHTNHDQPERNYHSRSSSPIPAPTYTRSPVIIKRTYSSEDLRMPHSEPIERRHQRMSRDDMIYNDMDGDQHRIIHRRRNSSENYESPEREPPRSRFVIYEVIEREHVDVEHVDDTPDPDAPLDLSMKYKSGQRQDHCDSGSESEDSLSGNGRQGEGRAYKKSLMKRYCKSINYSLSLY